MDTSEYESHITQKVEEAKSIAEDAREYSDDPLPTVESHIANTVAERCEKLLQIPGLEELIEELEAEGYGIEEMAFEIAEEFANGEVGDFDSADEKIEAAIRTAIALLTQGVVAAPIDGIGKVKIETNDDGTEYIRVPYFGPIRSAGGTGQALSVLVADHIRQELNISKFKPRDNEIHRYVEEMQLYEETTGLQYTPKEKEVKHIITHCPIMIDGVQTENREVGGYRDLERIEGNRPRGGMCLVVGEGIAQKAPKIQRYVNSIGIDDWEWIDELVEGIDKDTSDNDTDTETTTEGTDSNDKETTDETETDGGISEEITSIKLSQTQGNEFEPETKFKSDALAGRPIFGDAGQKGSFRLRYGRSRNTGIAASGLHPATMVIVDEFIATGTQLKTERPGKAQGAAPVSGIDGPTVKLHNGTVKQINNEQEAYEIKDQIDTIIDLGEMLVSYGEFVENNHQMAPAPWTPDWWHREYLHAGGDPNEWTQTDTPTLDQAISLSQEYNLPLHPKYTYFWSEITPEQYKTLSNEIANTDAETSTETVTLTLTQETTTILEHLNIKHTQNTTDTDKLKVTLPTDTYRCLNIVCDTTDTTNTENYDTTLQQINNVSPFEIRKRVTLRIGARMGRPEKSSLREMDDKIINALFPVGDAGKHKDILSAAEDTTGSNQQFNNNENDYQGKGIINTQLATRRCPDCNEETYKVNCPDCNTRTETIAACYSCTVTSDNHDVEAGDECPNPNCDGDIIAYTTQPFNINEQVTETFENLNTIRKEQLNTIKGVEGLSSASKLIEPLEKGALRAKHDVATFRDGTSRYDMVDLPLTHFKPNEANLPLKTAKELGYTHDIDNNKLTDETQILELHKQDLIIAEEAADYMLQVANYIDDILVDYYNKDPYYNADTKEDLIGHLITGLAPHTSAAVVGRIVGYTNIKAHYAHPIYHAAKRRNCFHPQTTLNYKLNGKWKHTTIQHLVETHLTNNADDTYTDGSIVQHINNHPEIQELKVPSITDDGHRTMESVESLTKNPTYDEIMEINLSSDETLRVTKDHSLEVIRNESLKEVNAEEVLEGDKMISNKSNHGIIESNWDTIDMLEVSINSSIVDNDRIMVRGMDKNEIEKVYRKSQDIPSEQYSYLQEVADSIGINKKTLSNYLYRDSVPVEILLKLTENIDELLEIVPSSVEIGVKRDNTQVPRMIEIDEETGTLLGYYTAEGFTRLQDSDNRGKTATGVKQVDIANIDPEAKEFIKRVFKKKFNVNQPYENNKRITASGTLPYIFFKDVVDGGDRAENKVVPKCIKNADESIKGAYLSGYISGDGSNDNNYIKMFTVSNQLKNDLIEVFNSIGMSVSITEKEPVDLHTRFPDFYEKGEAMSKLQYTLRLNSEDSQKFIESYGIHLSRKIFDTQRNKKTVVVENVSEVEFEEDSTYNITVNNTHRIPVSDSLYPLNCDGDEDSIMLLLDGFLNFSEEYLPDRRGARSMDAPLLMTSVVNPEEVDDEAHNVSVQWYFPLEFYYQTHLKPGPKEVDVELIEDRLGGEMRGLGYTTETDDIGAGPRIGMYGQLDGIEKQLEHQLELAVRTDAIAESVVATKVIEKHILPTVLGSLNSYTKQEFMCTSCYEKYKFPPFSRKCAECGSSVRKTMYSTTMENYTNMAQEIAEKYDLEPYMKQRLQVIDERLESLLENDKNKQSGLGDFM